MHQIEEWKHPHKFHRDTGRAERNTRRVIILTAAMMILEIAAGTIYGSMALLADGWHMATHAAALGMAAFAYVYARRHANNPRYSFGTGKVTALGGFGSAAGLAVVALMVAIESIQRLFSPVSIYFNQAILVAAIGLAVNGVSALVLQDGGHDHPHEGHGHAHEEHGPHHHDQNLRAAYFHVLADATTSVCAIFALLCGKVLNWVWMDPAMGILGSLIITRWSWVLIRDTGRTLLDSTANEKMVEEIRRIIEADSDNRIADLHVWQVGPGHLACIVSLVTHNPRFPDYYKRLLSGFHDLSHITIEVNRCESEPCKPA